jgi:hypothetical protein
MGFGFQAYTIDLYHLSSGAIRFLRTMPGASWGELIKAIRFMLSLVDLVDEIEKTVLRLRPLTGKQASTHHLSNVDRLRDEAMACVEALHVDGSRTPLRVGVVGDLYTMLEPFFNMDMERELGRLGIEVKRSFWFSDSLSNMVQEIVLHRGRNIQRIRAAAPYLSRDIGGFARSTVGLSRALLYYRYARLWRALKRWVLRS